MRKNLTFFKVFQNCPTRPSAECCMKANLLTWEDVVVWETDHIIWTIIVTV